MMTDILTTVKLTHNHTSKHHGSRTPRVSHAINLTAERKHATARAASGGPPTQSIAMTSRGQLIDTPGYATEEREAQKAWAGTEVSRGRHPRQRSNAAIGEAASTRCLLQKEQ